MGKIEDMAQVRELPAYKSKKIVRAAPITAIRPYEGRTDQMLLELGEYGAVAVTREWRMYGSVREGWYFVVYPDGYTSASPPKSFEDGNDAVTL